MSKNIYVLDTSLVLSEGRKALYAFKEHDVVIPVSVIKELNKKRYDPFLGESARLVISEISALMMKGNIATGVELGPEFGLFRVEMNHIDFAVLGDKITSLDNVSMRVLSVALNLQKDPENKDSVVIIVSKDIELKIAATSLGLGTTDLDDKHGRESDKFIRDLQEILITSEEMNKFHSTGIVNLDVEVPINVGCILTTTDGASGLAISKGSWKFKKITGDQAVTGKTGRSAEQKVLVDQLMDDSVGVVSVSGNAGSGKSFLMLAGALELVNDSTNEYNKIVIFRPVNPVGGKHQDLGFLPGTAEEKFEPHTVAIYDTLGTMMNKIDVDSVKRKGIIEFAPVAHVRGRTLSNCIVIVDEAQNLEAATLVTLISRLGINSRIFIGWDTAQRDAQFIGKYDGIFKIVRKLHGNPLFSHVSLKKSERSAVSKLVASLLEEM